MSDNLCADAELTSLSKVYDRGDDATHGEHRHRALDVAECNDSVTWKGPAGDRSGALTVRLKLHKSTDPRPEFEANGEAVETNSGPKTVKTPIEGLGERAYFGTVDTGNVSVLIVMALDGGAEFSTSVVADGAHSSEELKPLMIRDMRALMARLKA
ncbi:hypothetical protein [Streptomyces sp. NPDC050504]|uniref:hypothetical protein n=1 Tax=Streptomyces sp. NPDC050504 TaxID=3365618 RepID=UPI0037BE202E